MKFSTRKDIEAPAEFVFDRITDFDSMERQAMRRGIELSRKSPNQPRDVGASWTLKIPFRGKMRDMDAQITEMDTPNALTVQAKSGGLDMEVTTELVPLSPLRTRLTIGYEVRPQSLSARILVQSVKFAKGTLQKRFEKRVGKYCQQISDQYATAPKA